MENNKKIKTAKILSTIARYTLLVLGILFFLFALLSGSEQYGGGISGIIKNSPNALPGLILLAALFIAWKRELVGGIITALAGLVMLFFFVIKGNQLHLPIIILTLLITLLGVFFILSWYLRRAPGS